MILAIIIIIALFVAANVFLGVYAKLKKWPLKEWLAGLFGVNMTVILFAGFILFIAKLIVDFS